MALNCLARSPNSSGVSIWIRASRSPWAMRAAPACRRATGRATRALDVEADQDRQEGRADDEEQGPAERRRLHLRDLRTELRDGGLQAVDQAVGAVLDERDQHLRACVLLLDVARVVLQHGWDDAVPEHAIELVRGGGDVVHPRSLVRERGELADLLDHVGDVAAGTRVEHQVAVIPEDDGVRLVGVLVAHGARQFQRHTDAFLVVLHLEEAVVDAPHVRQGEVRGERERRDEEREGDEEALSRAESGAHGPAGPSSKC